MKKFLLTAMLLLICGILLCQTFIGILLDSVTQKPIEFANIGIVKQGIGTVSDASGHFTIPLDNKFDSDSLLFTIIGYKSIKYRVSEFKSNFSEKDCIILMKEAPTQLNEVVISKKKPIIKTLGIRPNRSLSGQLYGLKGLGYEFGSYIKFRHKTGRINEVYLHIASTSYDSLFFRLNVYKVSKGNFINILRQPIYVNISKKDLKDTTIIDLRKYNINVNSDFLVSVEIVKDLGKGEMLYRMSFTGRTYYRPISQAEWKKSPAFGYGIEAKISYEKTKGSSIIDDEPEKTQELKFSDLFRLKINNGKSTVQPEIKEIPYIFTEQNYIDIKKLPLLDCELANEFRNAYQSDSTKIFVVPDNKADSAELNKILQEINWTKFIIKSESELKPEDYEQLLVFLSPIQLYNYWEKFEIPIQKTKTGFSYNGINYTSNDDGIVYFSSNRIVQSWNSYQTFRKFSTPFYFGYFSYVIFRNGQLSKYGLFDNLEIDLEKIRQTNYDLISTKYFNLFVSKRLNIKEQNYDSIVLDICGKLKLNLPDIKINGQIHDEPNATRLFSCFFPLTGCNLLPDSVTFGTVTMNCIHSTGTGIGMLAHESFHLLWEQLVGKSGNNNTFFLEGIQSYFSFLKDSSQFKNAIEVALKHKDFDITNLVLQVNATDFWKSPSENKYPISYPISGLFVKMLVDNYGLNKFKEFYLYPNTEEGFIKVYNTSSKALINEYKKTFLKNK